MDFELETPLHNSQHQPQSQATDLPKRSSPKNLQRTGARVNFHDSGAGWRRARWGARATLYLGFFFYVFGSFFLARFDEKMTVADSVRLPPQQTPVLQPPFEFNYHDQEFVIQPVADYELSGLVVTHNDISSITDAYHDSKSVDFRDICVVWGANVGSGVFRRFDFWSEPWSCHLRPKDSNAEQSFDFSALSNNHFLSGQQHIRELIRSIHIGDQIRLQGKLINYWPKGRPDLIRRTSTIRTDTGNGACEVLWVENAQVLHRGETNWHTFRSYGRYLLVVAITLNIILYLITPLRHYRRFE